MQSFCRLCAVEKPHLIPIFSKNSLDISSKIINLLKITLKEDDYLPLTICTECFSKLNLFNVFKTNCLEAQEVLGFIFIDKKPIDEEKIDKAEEVATAEDEAIEEEEFEENTRLVKQEEPFNDTVELIQTEEAEDDDFEAPYDDDGSEQLQDDNESEEVLPDDMEMVEEEYLIDSNAEIEKNEPNNAPEDENYEIELLEANSSDSESEIAMISSEIETNSPFNEKHPGLYCTECCTYFEKRKLYEIHFREDHKMKPFFCCQVCLKTFTLYRSYTRHVLAHTGPKFKCDACDKTFIQKTGLQQHLLSHLDEKMYKCDQCDRSFKQNSSLYNHKANTHNENNKHICDICHKIFATGPVLKDHVKSKHSSIKDVVCETCGAEFASRAAMFYHKLSHKPKAYECEICFMKFKTNAQLKQHRLKNRCALGHILEEELFSCDYDQCFKKFITKTDLDLHLIKHHNDTFSFEI